MVKKIKLCIVAVMVVFSSTAIFSAAHASLVVTFDYSGSASAGINNANLSSFPSGGLTENLSGPINVDLNAPAQFATLIGAGTADPVNFLSGSIAAGPDASAQSQLIVNATFTNDTAAAQEFFWNGLIFAGGVGLVVPNLSAPSCSGTDLANCGSFLGRPGSLNEEPSAFLNFSGAVNGVELFSGEVGVGLDPATGDPVRTQNFNNIALEGFGLAGSNDLFFNWQDTIFSQSLGVVAPGDSVSLVFTIITDSFSNSLFACTDAAGVNTNCTAAYSGFGDPPPTEGGGWLLRSFTSGGSAFFSVEAAPIPVPGAVWLFASVLAGAFGARRLKKRRRA